MNYRELADTLLADRSVERENESAALGAAEIRVLSDLELVLAGGGDPVLEWP